MVQGLQPQVEKMEAAWARLHTITGAETPEEVLAYFEGMHLSQPLLARHPQQQSMPIPFTTWLRTSQLPEETSYQSHELSGRFPHLYQEQSHGWLAGLASKEASMRELVRLAEYAESRAKEDAAALVDRRSAMLEAMASTL